MKESIKFRAWDGYHILPWNRINQNSAQDIFCKFPWRIMRFTGLNDMLGREIWEGDIVKTNLEDPRHEIVWGDGGFLIGAEDALSEKRIEQWYLIVVGNIYENPELLR